MKYKDYLNLFLDLNSIPFSDNDYRSFLINTIFSPSQSSEKYYNLQYYNGNELIYTEQVLKGEKGKYLGVPQKSSDSQYSYTFVGWSKDIDDNIVDADAREGIIANRKVYACYTAILRTYTVTFKNDTGSTILYTQIINYGQTATYAGATPTSSEDASLAWLGWATSANAHQANAVLTNVQSDMIVYAAFESAVEVAEITDSWDTIIANIDNGTYATKYKVGNYKPLDLGTEGTINMQIVAKDADELADGSGYAPLTFIGMELLATKHRMNPANSSGAIGTGGNGGWGNCEMRSYLTSTILPLITTASATVASRLQRVKKIQSTVTGGTMVKDGQITYDKLWIPSSHEVGSGTTYESQGVVYSSKFTNATSRIKQRNGSNSIWWLRSAYNSNAFINVGTTGSEGNGATKYSNGVCLGFCLGLEPETIEDDWATILANTNPSASYAIGDTKYVDFGTYGKQLMEIVAFDEDDKADNSGKAKITWISKKIITTHTMNSSNTTTGGYNASEMKSWITSDALPQLQSEIRNAIVPVTKISGTYENNAVVVNGQSTTESLWIPSNYEMFGTTTYENTGAQYSKFDAKSKRIKYDSNGSSNDWWLRSASKAYGFCCVDSGGFEYTYYAIFTKGVVLGFCTD